MVVVVDAGGPAAEVEEGRLCGGLKVLDIVDFLEGAGNGDGVERLWVGGWWVK